MDLLKDFKEVEGYSGYFINKDGILVSTRQSYYIMKPYEGRGGYMFIKILDESGKIKHNSIHRLVAKAFVDNPNNKPQVNHINGIRNDNRADNLEWVTQQENLQHSYKNLGQTPIRFFKECKLYHNDEFVGDFKTINEASEYAANHYGVSAAMMRKWKKNKNCQIRCNDYPIGE